jgi:DNA-binding PadR family transcriptional regulator
MRGPFNWQWPGASDWSQMPWGRPGRFFGAGEVRLAILSLLADGSKNGYELMKELRLRSSGSYKMSAGTVYPALQQLEDEGLIVPDPKDGKKLFRLTELGKQEVEREKPAIDEIWRRTSELGDWAQWMGPGTARSAALALIKTTSRALKLAHGNPELAVKIAEILDRARRDLEDIDEHGPA